MPSMYALAMSRGSAGAQDQHSLLSSCRSCARHGLTCLASLVKAALSASIKQRKVDQIESPLMEEALASMHGLLSNEPKPVPADILTFF